MAKEQITPRCKNPVIVAKAPYAVLNILPISIDRYRDVLWEHLIERLVKEHKHHYNIIVYIYTKYYTDSGPLIYILLDTADVIKKRDKESILNSKIYF